MITISLKCPKHPRYQALRRPRCSCQQCELLWFYRDDLGPVFKVARYPFTGLKGLVK